MKRSADIVPHIESLWRYARVLTRDDADADDLLQESLARAIAFSSSYDPSRPIEAWLVTVVRNTFLTGVQRRQAEARRLRSVEAGLDDVVAAPQEATTELSQVARAFGDLPADQAEVLHLVGILGLSYKEAAEVLEVPIGTVMSRLSRARAALRAALEPARSNRAVTLRIAGGTDV
jgi:RNA polymerase sigma-70 factor (ECF subfamily)